VIPAIPGLIMKNKIDNRNICYTSKHDLVSTQMHC
jgi:hypothetical protein